MMLVHKVETMRVRASGLSLSHAINCSLLIELRREVALVPEKFKRYYKLLVELREHCNKVQVSSFL